MSYISDTLTKDEKVEVVAKFHWTKYFSIGVSAFITFIFFLIWIIPSNGETKKEVIVTIPLLIFALITLYLFLRVYLAEMVVTNKRVVSRFGVLLVKTEEIKNTQVESIETNQSIIGRMLGYADIYFSGTGSSKVKFPTIANPWKTKSRIEEVTNTSQK